MELDTLIAEDAGQLKLRAVENKAGDDQLLSASLRQAVACQVHRGSHALGMVDVASVLWSRFLRLDADDALWPDRDRFVVSTARFAPLLRALLALTAGPPIAGPSIAGPSIAGPPIAGPPIAGAAPGAEAGQPLLGFGQHPGVEMAIGPAGQGIATATGMAMAERILAERFGQSLVDHRSWVLACETDLAAGVALEAAALAGQMRLERLTVLFELEAGDADDDRVQASGEPPFGPMARFAACGWTVRRVDARDPEAIAQVIASAMRGRRPSLIACVVKRQPDADTGFNEGGSVPERAAPEAGAPQAGAQAAWRACGRRGSAARRSWLKRLSRHRQGKEFEHAMAGRLPERWRRTWREAWQEPEGQDDPDACGARHGLDVLLSLLPEFISLSCGAVRPSLSCGSVRPSLSCGPAGSSPAPSAPERIGRALSLGTQEHGMAALLNGIALHGGLLACGSASFIAVDRMRPALRLGALMGRQVIHLLTHDGLALGEDGAAWQPVEQLASLRAMPNVAVFRPADRTEMMECWQLALQRTAGPSVIAFSSGIPPDLRERVRLPGAAIATPIGNACARGGYVLADPPDGRARDVTLIATGAEIALAVAARDRLLQDGIAVAVVSLPCWEMFSAQSPAYREAILGSAVRVGIEAASGFGWERWLGPDGVFVGIDDFGVSAPADELYRQFGLTPEAVAGRVRRRLGNHDRDGNGLEPQIGL